MHVSVIRPRFPGRLFIAWFLGAGVVLSSCLPSRDRAPAAPPLQEMDFCMTREALLSGKPPEKARCISLLERFAAERGSEQGADRTVLQLCRFYMERRDFSAAYNLLLQFVDRYPGSREIHEAKLYLGICLYYLDDTKASLDILHGLLEDPDAGIRVVDAGRYIAEDYVKQGQLLSALTWFEKCDERMDDPEARRSLRQRVLKVMSGARDRELMVRVEDLFPEGFFHDAARLGTAAAALWNGEVRLAEVRLQEMALEHPHDELTPYVQALTARMGQEAVTGGVCTLGCLLPLSGRYAPYGLGILDALVLAAGAFEDAHEGSVAVRLLVRDTAGDRDTAVKELQGLARNPEVMGVVGPLLAGAAQACAVEAQKAGLPMITLTQREDVALAGNFVFQNGLTIRQQVDTLVEYAMGGLGISRFALLYPDDNYGAIAKAAYLEKVRQMGGEVVSQVSYQKDDTDFQDEIRALLGERYYGEMRRREAAAEKRDRTRRSSLASGAGDAYEPSPEEGGQEGPLAAPFEALFVPDHYRKASLIAPYLAFYDLNDVVLMGNNAWNSARLLQEAGDYVRDAVFVDGFFADSELPQVRRFVDAFERAFDRKPRVLEAQGYDSVLILENAFHQADPRTRAGIRQALSRLSDYPGLSGATSFDESGRARKRLYLLTVEENRIQEIPPGR